MLKAQRVWIIVGAVVAVLLICLFVVQHLLNADTYRGRIEAALSDSLSRPVKLGHLSFSLFSGSLVAESPSIADDPAFSSQPFLTAKDIRIGVETGALIFHHEIHITGLTIEQPAITLLRNEDGRWNYSSLGGEAKRKSDAGDSNNMLPNLTIAHLDIKGGTLTVGTVPAQAKPRIYSDLNVSARNFSFASTFPFTVSGKLPGGGSVDINGNAGPIDPHDASLTPLTAQIALKHTDLVAAGFVDPSQGVSGVADLDAKIVSNGHSAQAEGKLRLTQLKLAKNGSPSSQPVDVQFSINQDLQGLSGKIANANVQIGHATLSLTGTYTTRGNTTTAQMHAAGENMPMDDLVGFLPSLGVQLPPGARMQGGTLTTSLDITGPVNAPVISGPVRIANTQLAGFDLGSKLSSIRSLTGAKTGANTTIQVLSANVRYGPDGTHTDNLLAVVAGLGSASGSGSVSPAGALDYHLMVKLDATSAGGIASHALSLLPGALGSAVSQTTKNGIPLTIAGTTSNPVFTPDMSRMVGSSMPKTTTQSNPLGKALGGLLGR